MPGGRKEPEKHHQVAEVMMVMYLVLTPLVMTSWTTSPLTAVLFTFLSGSFLVALELIAAEIENPFGEDVSKAVEACGRTGLSCMTEAW